MQKQYHLQKNIAALADLKAEIDELRHEWDRAQEALMQTELGQKLDRISARIDERKERADELDSDIRSITVQLYQEAGERNPHPAVGVRRYTRLRYEEAEALYWAQRHLLKAIKLDKRFFEKHARAVADTQPIPFVEIYEEPRATIATDLSQYRNGGSDGE